MFRKVLALFVALGLAVGAFAADEIKGIFKKYEDGKVTVSVEDKDKTFKVDEKATVKRKIKGEEKDVKLVDIISKTKADSKVTLTVEKDLVIDFKQEKKGK